MKRHTVSALRWCDLVGTLWGCGGAALALRQALTTALHRPPEALWLTGAGRGALHAFVRATQRQPDDEALLPGYTCVVVPNVFLHVGVSVRYVDIAADGVNPSPDAWAQAITPRTRWVVWPHNFGVPSAGIAALRARFPHVLFIEDAAHAWGSRHADGSLVGTHGHAAFFSFEYSKCLSTGLGGALLVNEPTLRPAVAEALAPQHALSVKTQVKVLMTLAYHLMLATWPSMLATGLTALLRAPSRALGLVAATRPAELSGHAQPDYLQALPDRLARLALPQLARMPQVLALRHQQARHYAEALAGSPWLTPLSAAEPATLLRFPLRVAHPAQRDALRAGLRALDIEPGVWFDDVVHPAGSLRHGYTEGDCPNGERLARCIVNLPLGLHARLSQRQWQGLRRLAQTPPEITG
jgi:dTDP-4-amino-4,6-dideoxygalactose transaminase